jgi:DNA-directed RNA polymerase specialized sigma24 family protein
MHFCGYSKLTGGLRMEIQNLEQAVNYGKRIAYRMSRDPDAQASALTAAWRAFETFDPDNGVPLNRYIAVCVKRSIYDMWRRKAKKREQQKSETWWAEVFRVGVTNKSPYDTDDFDARPKGRLTDSPETETDSRTQLAVTPSDWQTLVEYYLHNWPYDVIARRRGWKASFSELRKIGCRMVREATEKLQ